MSAPISAVVTAAGLGRRFGALTHNTNKCLQTVNGVPLLIDILDKLQARGIDGIHVITGYQRSKVERALAGRARPHFNPFYEKTGIVVSLWMAQAALRGSPFVFTTGDHYFTPMVLDACLEPSEGVRFVLQEKERCDAEDAKVVFEAGAVRRFGKQIAVARAAGEFAGMARFSARASELFFATAERRLEAGDYNFLVMDVFNEMIEAGDVPFDCARVPEGSRIEIDHVHDLRRARGLAGRSSGERPLATAPRDAARYEVRLDSVEAVVDDLRAGKFVVLLDHPGREGEGDLIAAAARTTPAMINFQITHARGAFVAVLMPEAEAERLDLPLLVPEQLNAESQKTGFRLTCDSVYSSSGCSAADRAQTVGILGGALRRYDASGEIREERSSTREDLVRPGHVIPISGHRGGLAARQGHTEAGIELLRLAGFDPPVAVDMEMLHPDGSMASAGTIRSFADRMGLKLISVPQLCR